MLRDLLFALVLTAVLELAFAFLWGLRGRRTLGLVVLVNCLTNPLVNLGYLLLVGNLRWSALPVTAGLEAAAVLAEWWWYKNGENTAVYRPLLFSLCANAFSFSCGVLLQLV